MCWAGGGCLSKFCYDGFDPLLLHDWRLMAGTIPAWDVGTYPNHLYTLDLWGVSARYVDVYSSSNKDIGLTEFQLWNPTGSAVQAECPDLPGPGLPPM